MSSLSVDAITAKTANTNLTLTGSGTGKVVLGDGSLVLPDADGTNGQFLQTNGSGTLSFADVASAGVVQVKGSFSDAYATHANTNVNNPVDIISVSITPTSASNKILIVGQFTGAVLNANYQYIGVKLIRGSTEIGSGDNTTWNTGVGEIHSADNGGSYTKPNTIHALYLDSPATTSATTYKIQAFGNYYGGGLQNLTLVENGGGYNYNNAETAIGVTQLIVMEVTP
jgi:hypothetical protein